MLVAAKQFNQMKNADNPRLTEFRTKTIEKKEYKILKTAFLDARRIFLLTYGSEKRVEEKVEEEYEYCWAMTQAEGRSFCGPGLSGM